METTDQQTDDKISLQYKRRQQKFISTKTSIITSLEV